MALDTSTPTYDYSSAIAIIGMSGRFPASASVDELWQMLVNGATGLRRFEDAELLAAGVDPSLLADPNYVRVGTTVPDIDRFDAPFFGYTPLEAEMMDPQHRLFLECAWEALEHAAYDPESYDGLIGIFGGSGFCTYLLNNLFTRPELIDSAGKLVVAAGNERDSLTSTVSYKFNLRGPSVAVQTFCSTSLVAVHMACQSLLNYESDIALAGGVAITIPQEQGYLYEEGGILSPDGVCRTFDAAANGSVMGNGVGIVTLKRLDEALEDGDQIYAVIRGSAVNNDGILRVGYTAPGLDGQSGVIAEALSHADVPAETISYLEAHGTATPLGDAVELAATIRAFSLKTDKKQFCAIGSLKPNIGHLDRASGVTGLIKTALALHHQQIPPSLNFERPHPDVDLAHSPFYVNTMLREWRTGKNPRRAGVSSFGLGGTNAHVVLEECPSRQPVSRGRDSQIVILSAKSAGALEAATANLARHLKARPQLNLADVAYTLQVGRSAFSHRRMFCCRSIDQAIAALESVDPAQVQTVQQVNRARGVALCCTEINGADRPLLADLYATEPTFRAEVDACAKELQRLLGVDVRAELRDTASTAPLSDGASFAAGYALAQVVMSWGVEPEALIGDGIGAYVAASLAGVFEREEALQLVAAHARGDLSAALENIEPQPPQIPLVSNLTNAWLSDDQASDRQYWLDQQRSSGLADRLALIQERNWAVVLVGSTKLPATGPAAQAPVLATLRPANAERGGTAQLMPTLGELWLAGVKVDWAGLYADERRQRLPLPTYPFERQRYWVEPGQATAASTAKSGAKTGPVKKSDMADWFYLPTWKQSAGPELGKHTADGAAPWLVFVGEESFSSTLVETLAGHRAPITVRAGSGFVQHSATAFTIDPQQPDDYQRLFNSIPQPPQTIIHGWSLGTSPELSSASFEQAQHLGFYSLLFLARALGRLTEPVTVWALTNQAQAITGGEQLDPTQAPVAGACRVIAQEYGHVQCRHLDLALPLTIAAQERRLAQQVLAEIRAEPVDRYIAYRGTQRWIQEFEPLPLAQPAQSALRTGGVYLITGGLGGIGLVVAQHLARTYQARLVLTGRSTLPAREEWSAVLEASAPGDSLRAKIELLRELETLGADVLVLSADVSDEQQMRQVVETAIERFGALHGVIHAAGISDERSFGIVQDVSREACEQHFAPKVHGTLALERVLEDCPLDFCLVMSSLSSVLGGLGFAGYTAANIALDAIVYRHNQRHAVPWLSVNWDTWGLRADQHAQLGQTVAVYEMTPAEGIHVLERLLASREVAPRIVISTGELQTRLDQWVRVAPSDPATEQAAGSSVVHPRPLLPTPYVAPSGELEEHIAAIWQRTLGIEPIGIHDHFLDLGGNSLIATQVITRLRQQFQLNLPLTLLFDAPTIEELSLAIELALIEEIQEV
jgi:acyl transferase domain-containing protein/acyl carrier protein